MKKRGQLELSFSMIFSIILIIAFVGVAIYAIVSFLNLGACGKIGLYYNDLQNEVTKAWQGEITYAIFEGTLPSGIEKVCFGNISQSAEQKSREEQLFFRKYASYGGNVFMYRPEKACGQQLASKRIEHMRTNAFFCVNVEKEKISIKLSKGEKDSEVTLSE